LSLRGFILNPPTMIALPLASSPGRQCQQTPADPRSDDGALMHSEEELTGVKLTLEHFETVRLDAKAPAALAAPAQIIVSLVDGPRDQLLDVNRVVSALWTLCV
jgi:hypothetical protein